MNRETPTPGNAPVNTVVIGASIVGCMAAAAAAAQISDRVTLIEKSEFGDDIGDRQSVPQEKHVHLFLLRGKQVLERFFPGIVGELETAGAVAVDQGHGVKWLQQGRWKQRFPTGICAHYCSRALMDRQVRQRIRGCANIEVWSGARVTGLMFDRGRQRSAVVGVTVERGGQSQMLPADLVIDAGGRGSPTAGWLSAAGLGTVPEALVKTDLGYASRVYRRRPEFAKRWQVLLVFPTPPGQRRMGVISPIEGDRWLVTTGGWFREFPAATAADFLEFVKTLPAPDVYDAVRDAEPMSDVSVFAFPGSRWRHYEQMANWPDGLLIMGDALCCLNPIYSQGMTVGALQAETLKTSFADWRSGSLSSADLQMRFAEMVRPAWDMAHAEDMRFPETPGERTMGLKWRHWYGARFAELSATHRLSLQTQIGITNLVTPPRAMYRPTILGRVAAAALARWVWFPIGGST